MKKMVAAGSPHSSAATRSRVSAAPRGATRPLSDRGPPFGGSYEGRDRPT